MIVPDDEDYQQTKRIKMRGAPLPAPFQELADWIAARYAVRVLNVIRDTIEPRARPRLNIVLEADRVACDETMQREVRDQFEANSRVTDHDLEQLRQRLAMPDVWKIRHRWDTVTFFFYTDAPARAATSERFAHAYAQVIAPYDEFGYLAKRGITVLVDSKENFDSVYQSNWFYYDR